jgi:acyl-CoA reductase-like NAD-dependent aldehyde dehydrogenase
VVANELSTTAKTRRAVNPSNEEELFEVPVSTQEDVDRTVAAAKAAFPSWSSLSQDERAAYITKFLDAIEANQQEFSALLGKETGKPPQATGMELSVVLHHNRETLKLRFTEELIEDSNEVCLLGSLELVIHRPFSETFVLLLPFVNLANPLGTFRFRRKAL